MQSRRLATILALLALLAGLNGCAAAFHSAVDASPVSEVPNGAIMKKPSAKPAASEQLVCDPSNMSIQIPVDLADHSKEYDGVNIEVHSGYDVFGKKDKDGNYIGEPTFLLKSLMVGFDGDNISAFAGRVQSVIVRYTTDDPSTGFNVTSDMVKYGIFIDRSDLPSTLVKDTLVCIKH